MVNKRRIKIDLYWCSVIFIITDNVPKYEKVLFSKYKPIGEPIGDVRGLFLSFDNHEYYVIINRNYLDHNTIGHELKHCMQQLCLDRGIKDDESQAWIMGYLQEKFYEMMRDKNIGFYEKNSLYKDFRDVLINIKKYPRVPTQLKKNISAILRELKKTSAVK